jgi:hypothetical protein
MLSRAQASAKRAADREQRLVLFGKRDKPPHRDSYYGAVGCFGTTGDFIAPMRG